MKLALHIAWRYLFARKSHNVINVISAISAVGMAVGTAALILILSVYNGFDRIIESNISDLDPDLRVQAATGKFFAPDSVMEVLGACPGKPLSVIAVLEDNVFLSYGEGQTIVRARGVPDDYISDGVLAGHLREGGPAMRRGDIPLASVGTGIASKLGISPRFIEGMKLYYPDRDGTISLANPSASLRDAVVFPGSTFAISTDIDNSLVLVPIDVMHELLGEAGVSGIEIRVGNGAEACPQKRLASLDPTTGCAGGPPSYVAEGGNGFWGQLLRRHPNIERIKREMTEALGPGYVVLDRYQMHPTLFRMMKLEKAAIYMILLFVVIIVAFNIFGSLSMLVIEKTSDMAMIRAMGGTDSFVRDVFRLEGWLISLFGLVVGLVFGVGLTLLQQRFGLVKLPGNFLIDAYPVALEFSDVLLTAAGVALIGFLVSLLAAPDDR